ncbi:uncharacterized protein YvpB [Scopulibacillus darangshiensis]|uniref:Uncharacterized protein YvpB n=1 Tax=Scopulibacillus darangshiensis TaxID=442528 RepID=A0A4R2NTZ7_9BACL|nr:C39 family peptidase [Scopulibacillus darangshiensis]TCP24964.1 uncharacterized protein YvpB [Scopulibacillus darangshiensis]
MKRFVVSILVCVPFVALSLSFDATTPFAGTRQAHAQVTGRLNKTFETSVRSGIVRGGPGTEYKMIGGIAGGDRVNAFEKVMNGNKPWYHVTYHGNQEGWVSSTIVKNYQPINAPFIKQMPELPRGCEVTSLAMMLQYAGKNADNMSLAKQIRKVPFEENGLRGHPNDGFVGNMYTFDKPGLGVFHSPIANLARDYLGDRVVDMTGEDWDAVQEQVDTGHPVWVVVTSTYQRVPDEEWQTWHTKSGDVRITYHEHSVLITGYDNQYVYFNDPLADAKNSRTNKADFITGWKQFGNQAISYK